MLQFPTCQFFLILVFTFKSFINIYWIYNVVIIPAAQHRHVIIHRHTAMLFQILFQYRLSQTIGWSFLCYTAGPLWPVIHILECVYANPCQFFSFFFFSFSGAAPGAHGGSQAGGLIGAAASSLHQNHSNTGSEPHLQATPQLTATPDP